MTVEPHSETAARVVKHGYIVMMLDYRGMFAAVGNALPVIGVIEK